MREIAELAGVAPYTISRFETEQGGLRMDTADKIKAALVQLGVRFVTDERGRNCICYDPPGADGTREEH